MAKFFGDPMTAIGDVIIIGDKHSETIFIYEADDASSGFGKMRGEIQPPEAGLKGFGSILIPMGNDLLAPALKTVEVDDGEGGITQVDEWIFYRYDFDPSSATFGKLRHILPLPEDLKPNDPHLITNGQLLAICKSSSSERDNVTYTQGQVHIIDSDPASDTYGERILLLEEEIESTRINPLGEQCGFAGNLVILSKWEVEEERPNYYLLNFCWYDCDRDSATFGQLVHESPDPEAYGYRKIVLAYDTIAQSSPLLEDETTIIFYDTDPESQTFGEALRTITLPQPALGWTVPSITYIADKLLVSDAGYDGAKADCGAIYVFDNDPASAAYGQLIHTLENPTPSAADFSHNADQFGASVAVAGGNIVTNAVFDDTAGFDAGAVYIFDGDDYTQKAMITTPNRETARFGHTITIAGNYLAVSLPLQDGQGVNEGAVQLYDPATGSLVTTLKNPTPLPNDLFGEVLASDGRLLAVKSTYGPTGLNHHGRVHLFDIDPVSDTFGDHLFTIDRPDLEYDRYEAAAVNFGAALALENGKLTITCPTYAQVTESRYLPIGVAFIYDADPNSAQFGQQTSLVINPFIFEYENEAPAGTRLSNALAFMGDSILTASIWEGDDPSGRVYLVDPAIAQNANANNIILHFDDPQPEHKRLFGNQIKVLNGDRIAVTAAKSKAPGSDPSVVYIFDGKIGSATEGDLLLTIENPEPDRSENFGNQLQAMDGMLIIGALNKFSPEGTPGNVYVFDVDPASPTFGEMLFALATPADEAGCFGQCLATRGTKIYVGDPFIGPPGETPTGAVYIYDLSNAAAHWNRFK